MKKRLILLVITAALIASGCFKVNMTVDVNEDGSGSFEGLTAFNFDAIGGLLEDLGDDLGAGEDEICGDVESEFGVSDQDFEQFEAFNEDGFCGVRFSTTFAAGELNTALGGINGDNDAILLREGDGWYFELPIDAADLGTDDVDSVPGIEGLLGDAEYVVKVRLPGTQVEHNGEIDSNGFVIWDIDISNPPDRIFLRTEPGETITGTASAGGDDGDGSAVKVILIVVVVLAALGLAAWLLMRNRKDGSDEAPASGIAATLPGPPTVTETAAPMSPPVDPNAVMDQPHGDFAVPPVQPPGNEPPPTQPVAIPPPTEPVATPPAPVSEPAPAAEQPQVIASPTPEQATGQPTWDPVRRKYVQWDPGNNRWLTHDEATGTWAPE
jgi:hypothetical protein